MDSRSQPTQSRLRETRLARNVTQFELARRTGLSLSTYQRLENGQMNNPPVRYLANCALALEVQLEDLIDDQWREWLPLDVASAAEPPQSGWWQRNLPSWLNKT